MAPNIPEAENELANCPEVTPPAAPTRNHPPELNRRRHGYDQSPTGVGDLVPRNIERSMGQPRPREALRLTRQRNKGAGTRRTRPGPRRKEPHGRICDHVPCERPAQDALPAFHDPAGIVDVLWLCGPCAEDTAAHSGPRTRSQPPLEEPHAVWYQETCDACGEGDPPIDLKDQPPKTPRRRRKRSESPEHSPEYVSARKNQSTPGSNHLTTPRPIRGTPRNRECILKGCSLRAEEGTCRNTGEPKLACTRAHYLRHKKRHPRARKQKEIRHKVWNETHPLR